MAGQEARHRKSKGSSQRGNKSTSPFIEEDEFEVESHSCTWTILKIFVLVLFASFLILILLPSPIDPISHRFPEAPALEGVLKPNDILSKAQHLYQNEVLGPESIVIKGDHMYTGTADGRILDIHKGEIRVLARFGQEPCGGFENEPTCGRPLGMRFDNDGYLIVCDAYLGLHKVNVATGDVHVLWPHTAPIDGELAKLFNAVVIASSGMIYFTHSSTRWDRRHFRFSILEADMTGRLIQYDPVHNTTTVLASGLSFPNGLELSRGEDFLIMAETTKARLWKYHLSGANKGAMEIVNNNLPGFPDNIQKSSSGGFWVGLAAVRSRDRFSMLEFTAPYPWMRSLMAKLPQEVMMKMLPKYGLALEVDQSGKIIRSLHDPTGEKVGSTCDLADKDGVLYLGSYYSPYMGKVYLTQQKKKS